MSRGAADTRTVAVGELQRGCGRGRGAGRRLRMRVRNAEQLDVQMVADLQTDLAAVPRQVHYHPDL